MVHFFSRSRAANPAPTPSSQPAQPTQPFPYRPLDPTVDGTRLVILEPAKGFQDPVRCRLRHVTFGERPKYEALSYMWGDAMVRKSISIDGHPFDTTLNLLDALRCLRHKENERVLWVDAICINQHDDREKSRQIRIMPYIYMRAKVVLAWLGLFRPPLDRRSNLRPVEDWQIFFYPGGRFSDQERGAVLQLLCSAPYWNRLWIIQEISVARNIQICYERHAVDWKNFIQAVSAVRWSNVENNIPMRLKREMEDKYAEGHKLQNLIENHQQALCKEPRDHVYGFVGLASDCVDGFPIDYRKSLFEVWKDTIMFKNSERGGSRHDTMKFGRLVQKVLGGPSIATADEIYQDLTLRKAHPGQGSIRHGMDSHNPYELLIASRLVGCIRSFGPTHHSILSDPKEVARWRASINQYIPRVHVAGAMEESELFLETMKERGNEALKMITSFHRDITWKPSIHIPRTVHNTGEGLISGKKQGVSGNGLRSSSYILKSLPTEQHLFLLELWGGGHDSPGRIGLAPPEARIGDLVLQIHGIERAVLVRNDNGLLRLVGIVVLAENRERARAARRESAKRHLKFGAANFAPGGPSTTNLSLDVAIAYQLLLG